MNTIDYRVNIGSKVGTYHINLLKKNEEMGGRLAGATVNFELEECKDIGVVDD